VQGLLTVDDALARILDRARPLAPETVPVAEAAGRVLCEPAVSPVDLPPFASSAMDGFAVRAVETPGELPVAFRIAAGTPPPGPLPSGTAAGIATGGTVPVGADAVVPVEQASDLGDRVGLLERAQPGQHVRPRGGDVRKGAVVIDAGRRLGAAQVGALAATGIAKVVCSMRPRVAVLATGNELRAPGDPLGPGQIYDSNRAMIAASLVRAGADVELQPVVEDDVQAHRAALERGLEADVLVTTGGVSMGPHDLVRRVSSELGVEEVFWGVAVKPGKPLSFGVRGATLVFGLPGNPVSALVGTLVFVRPALLARQGMESSALSYEHGRAARALRRNPQRDEFLRARRLIGDDGVVLEPVTGQDSHMIVRAAAADALVHVPRGDGEIAAGTPIRYLTLD
jgi:molybdopterin molybdotransferase